jgi:hypothetical protein
MTMIDVFDDHSTMFDSGHGSIREGTVTHSCKQTKSIDERSLKAI